MKTFKLVGPMSTREFDIEEDEMVLLSICKTEDYEMGLIHNPSANLTVEMQNVKIYPTGSKHA